MQELYKRFPPFDCPICGTYVATPRAVNQRFCSRDCRQINDRNVMGAQNGRIAGASTGTVGAIGELIACTELLRHGYEVFRALSQSCSCDLIALKNGKALRVEVRSASITSNNVLGCTVRDTDEFDVLALVVRKRDVIFIPSLATISFVYSLNNHLTEQLKARGFI